MQNVTQVKEINLILMAVAFEELVCSVARLPHEQRFEWGCNSTDNVFRIARSFEYYAMICAAGREAPTTEGFRQFIFDRADALARVPVHELKKYKHISADDLYPDDENEAEAA